MGTGDERSIKRRSQSKGYPVKAENNFNVGKLRVTDRRYDYDQLRLVTTPSYPKPALGDFA